jgi:dihydroorotase
MRVTGKPLATIIRGSSVMRDGALLDKPRGRPVRFTETFVA